VPDDLDAARTPAVGAIRPVRVDPRPLAGLLARLDVVQGPVTGEVGAVVLTGVTHDSRAVRRGDLYAALPGARTHGAAFAGDAHAAGAVAVLTDPAGGELVATRSPGTSGGIPTIVVADPRRVLGPVAAWVYGEPAARLRTFGVTGTNGKTTTSYLLEAGLRAAGMASGLVGTVETRFADVAVPSVRTTPEAADLQALFAVMVERGVAALAMEVSSHALALHRIDGTTFDVAGFTNLSQDHLDFHKDLDDYFAAKARLFQPDLARLGVVNVDDAHGRRLRRDAGVPTVTVSALGDPAADWRAADVVASAAGSRFTAVGPSGEWPLEVALPGRFNVANALLAFAMLVSGGVAPEDAATGIAGLAGVPGRMERVDAGQPFEVVVDYAHTPDAVATLLGTVRETARGEIVVVLGCGGDRDAAKRPLMGAAAARLADVAVLTSDNPRSEDPRSILDAVVAGARGVASAQRAEVVVELDRAVAIGRALRRAAPGDVVVIAGKGHEQGQEVAGVVHPFDDRAVARTVLAELGWAAGSPS
jgi:UDP-N-acetylmuramoyl-L-alanyl-D-glutamate--2,6-diaminopimelate ligase